MHPLVQNMLMIRCDALCALSVPVLALTACTQFPELAYTQTRALESAEYPALVPIEPILANAPGPAPDPTEEMAILNTRLTALRARADRMRGAVLNGAEKQRLKKGLR